MDNRIITATLIIFGILMLPSFLTGCSGSNDPKVVIETDVFTGTEGLAMTFIKDSPPKEIYENQEFPIALTIENRGAYDITDGHISLIKEGHYVDVLGWDNIDAMTEDSARFSLEGRSKLRSKGDSLTFVIKMKAKTLETQAETHTVFTSVNACYRYRSYFGQSVCIDTDMFETKNQEKACQMEDLSSSGQGGPVGVTKVEPSIYSLDTGKVNARFKITISNLGQGEIINPDKTEEACSSADLKKDDFNLVKIKAQLPDNTLKCEPNPVRIRDKEGGVSICEIEGGMDSQGTYMTLLQIELEYGYTSMISGETEIRRVTV